MGECLRDMPPVVNIIDEVDDKRRRGRDWESIKGVAVHRVGVSIRGDIVLGYDAVSICHAFLGKVPKWSEVAAATGGTIAYTFMIGGNLGPSEFDGVIWQCLALDDIGSHARNFNAPYLGIGCIGDFRDKAMGPKQYASLVDLCTNLTGALGIATSKRLLGHGELPGYDGPKRPGMPDACPGDLLDMDGLRFEVDALSREAARRRLHDAGVTFTA